VAGPLIGSTDLVFRHGEKQHETLVSKEEMLRAIDYKNYYKIPIDNRDLNYESFFTKGKNFKICQEYNSLNTNILNVSQTIKLILPVIKKL
jgi:UDP-glucose 4-epimerase